MTAGVPGVNMDMCILRASWLRTLTQPHYPAASCYVFLRECNKLNALRRLFQDDPQDMLLALKTCTSPSKLHLKYRHRFLACFNSIFPELHIPVHALLDCVQAVETAPPVHEVFPLLCDIGRSKPGPDIIHRVQIMFSKLATVLTTNNMCLLAKLFHAPTPIWFHFQGVLLSDGCISLQPCVLYFIEYLQKQNMLVEPLPAFLQRHKGLLYMQPAAAFQLVSLVHAERHRPQCVQMFLPLTIALTGYLTQLHNKRFPYAHQLCKFAELWTQWRHLLPHEVAVSFTTAYWSNPDSAYFEAATVFCDFSENVNLWARWLKGRDTDRHVRMKMMDTLLEQVHWPDLVETSDTAAACRVVIMANVHATDEYLCTVAKAWRFVSCCLTPDDGSLLLDEIFLRNRLVFTLPSSVLQCALHTALTLVQDGCVTLLPEHMPAVNYLWSSTPEIRTVVAGFMALNLSPPCVLPIIHTDSLLRYRQIVCFSRQRDNSVTVHSRKLFRQCVPLLETAMDSPEFDLNDERTHCLTLALMLQPGCFIAKAAFNRLLDMARSRKWLSPAVCEVGLQVDCQNTAFRVYFTHCVLSLLQQRSTISTAFLNHWFLMDTAAATLFAANLPAEQVDSLFLYAVFLCPEAEQSAAFASTAIQTGAVSALFARAVAVLHPVLIPDVQKAYPAATDFLLSDCGICMERMLDAPDTTGPLLYCHPGFHNLCLQKWWAVAGVDAGTCPLCKCVPAAFTRPLRFMPLCCTANTNPAPSIVGSRFYASAQAIKHSNGIA